MYILGTAGHIDHGKSTLITALTGINPDRLQEEQTRGMTVDLGFAWFSLPNGNVGVVDVPGHHRLVKNMLAGVGMVDFALLVVAADDGWMPQTQEHADILHLYGVKHGLVAITKADMVEPDWLELVQGEVEENLKGTSLEGFPIIPVSAVTGQNMDKLRDAMNEIIAAIPDPERDDNPLLWIDRVFTIKGSGTVVTGTLVDGYLTVGMEVEIKPIDRTARIRGLQSQTETVERGVPRSRLAVNLSGVETDQLARGMYLALPGQRPYFSLINAHVQMLSSAPAPLKTGQQVKMYVGTLETLAQVRVLGADVLRPGEGGYVQLEMEEPAHFSFLDRFVLRHSELQDTLGGGMFVEAGIPVRGRKMRLVGPKRRQHLFPFEQPESFLDLSLLAAKHQASEEERGLLAAADRTYWTVDEFRKQGYKLHPDLAVLGDIILAPTQLKKVEEYLLNTVEEFHREQPLAPGPNKETLRASTGLPSRLFDQIVANHPQLQERQEAISAAGHKISLSAEDGEKLAELEKLVNDRRFEPPSLSELEEEGYSRELIYAAGHLGSLIALANGHWTTPEVLDSVLDVLFAEEAFRGEFSLAAFRDHFGTSRKYALAFLDYFDRQGITTRKGDVRLTAKRP